MEGMGLPNASQVNVADEPALTFWLIGASKIRSFRPSIGAAKSKYTRDCCFYRVREITRCISIKNLDGLSVSFNQREFSFFLQGFFRPAPLVFLFFPRICFVTNENNSPSF
jgi:hypothetical protein